MCELAAWRSLPASPSTGLRRPRGGHMRWTNVESRVLGVSKVLPSPSMNMAYSSVGGHGLLSFAC